jgi:glycosyltransferase involved in cell wall biosynthesis
MQAINILFYNQDVNGVNYYRTLKPATQLYKDYPTEFFVEVKNNVDWTNDEYLKNFQIIHFHRTMTTHEQMPSLVSKLKSFGIVLIMDLDDYWDVSDAHPLKGLFNREPIAKNTLENIKLVDYVTTTTPVFASYIRPYNKNVIVLENAIDDTEEQWKYQPYEPLTDKSRILWLGGSSHLADLSILKDSIHKMKNDVTLKDKYQFNIAGFDLRGSSSMLKLNPQFEKNLAGEGLLTQRIMDRLQKVSFDLDALPEIPQSIKDAFRGDTHTIEERAIKPDETVWYAYEKIFTTDHQLITDKGYLDFLNRFSLDERYPNELSEQPYIRHKTRNVHEFAQNYRHADIALAPLYTFGKVKKGKIDDSVSNRYQFAKSNLKVIESAFHKIPLIASEVPTYTFDKDFVDGKNIVFVSPDRQEKDWLKKIKMLIQNPNMAKDIGEAAYETVKNKYALKTITAKRAEFYKRIVK